MKREPRTNCASWRLLTLAGLGVCGVFWAGCGVWTEPQPEELAFSLSGSDGKMAEVIYAQDFVSGTTETGDTRVVVITPDTVIHTLPIDTVINIAPSDQWFVWVRPLNNDTLEVQASVSVDGRSVYSQYGGIYPNTPWAFVYLFNKLAVQADEVVF